MNRHDHHWRKLVAAARHAPDARPVAAPFGFATRMAALGLAAPAENPLGLFEKFALRGLLAAFAFTLAAIAFGYGSWHQHDEETIAANDTVGEILANS